MKDRRDVTLNSTYPVDWIADDDAADEAERRCAYCDKRIPLDRKPLQFWTLAGRPALVCWPCEASSTFNRALTSPAKAD